MGNIFQIVLFEVYLWQIKLHPLVQTSYLNYRIIFNIFNISVFAKPTKYKSLKCEGIDIQEILINIPSPDLQRTS